MKRKIWFMSIVAAACCWSATLNAQVNNPAPAQNKYAGYLFAYFKGGSEAIHFATSRDGYTYRALNGNNPVIDPKAISSTGGVRDPHIMRAQDGKTFYMVATDMVAGNGWDSNRAMVLMKSTDLVNWTHSVINIQQKYAGQEELKRVWAPQTIYDDKAGKYMIYWSMKHGSNGRDIIYYAYANADFTDLEGEPKVLFDPRDGKACIDGDIVPKNGLYHMFYKTEGHGDGIRRAITDDLTAGRWIEQPGYKQQTNKSVEGSFVFRLHDENKYILMYDVYRDREYQFCESIDLDEFRVIDQDIDMDFHPRHGSIISVTEAELKRVEEKW